MRKIIAENFVFKGKFFVASKDINKIKDILIDFLQSEGFKQVKPFSFFHNYFSLTFCLQDLKISIPLGLKIKRYFGMISEMELKTLIHFKSLSTKRDEIPYEVNISMYMGKYKDLDGIIIEITSKPVIYIKIATQLIPEKIINKEEYSFVNVENTEFIRYVAKALHGLIIEEPKPLKLYVTTEIINNLEYFGFANTAKMIRNGKEKIELGNSDGLDDLRGAIEDFLYEIILKINETPYPLDQSEKNIQKLKNRGYINDDIKILIESILHKGIYRFLSNVRSHPRKEVDLFTSRLCFDATEDVINNLMERVIHYKLKTSNFSEEKEEQKN